MLHDILVMLATIIISDSTMVNVSCRFCLIATNNSMAQEIGYGERECQVKNETWVKGIMKESNNTAEFCKKNISL